MGRFNYIDLFAGCGGLSLGLHNAGWKGVFAVEKSEDAFKTLSYNLINNTKHTHFVWPDWLDIKNWEIDNLIKIYAIKLKELRGQIDLVAGGPPCQGFSMAGRRNQKDIRNLLVLSYIKFIKLVRPRVIFFENVKGFTLSFKKTGSGDTPYSELIMEQLNKAGYHVYGKLVDFSEYGVPQKRTRFILIGLNKKEFNEEHTKKFFNDLYNNRHTFLKNKGLSATATLEESIGDLLLQNGTYFPEPMKTKFKFGKYGTKPLTAFQEYMTKDSILKHPDSHRFANHSLETINRFQELLHLSQDRRNLDISKDIREKYAIKKHTIIPLCPSRPAPTITTLPDDYIHYCEPRILTVREYARIQTFPDWYLFQGKYTTGGILRKKETPRYTQIGNAIPPLFSEQVGIILRDITN